MGILGPLVKIATSIIGGNAQKKGVNNAIDTYTRGANQAADQLVMGNNEAAAAKLMALEEIGALTKPQVDQTIELINAGEADFVKQILEGAENYAMEMNGGAQKYAGALERASKQFGIGLNALGDSYANATTQAGIEYEAKLGDTVSKYGGEIQALADQLGTDFVSAAQVFQDTLDQTGQDYAAGEGAAAGQYGADRMHGVDALRKEINPYAEGRGTEALDYMRTAMGADPTKLDPAQSRMREEFLRDETARLAASGLRGAGRAGIAAVNSGDADLRARLYTENRDRADQFARNIADTGYRASSALGQAGEAAAADIASNRMDSTRRGLSAISSARQTGANTVLSARDRGAVARQTAGEEAARAAAAAGEQVADKQLTIGKDNATQQLALGKDATTNAYNTGKDVAANTQDATRRIAGVNLEAAEGIARRGDQANSDIIKANDRSYDQQRTVIGARGDTIAERELGNAGARAGATADTATVAANGALAKGQIKAETIGQIGSSVGDIVKTVENAGANAAGGGGKLSSIFSSQKVA